MFRPGAGALQRGETRVGLAAAEQVHPLVPAVHGEGIGVPVVQEHPVGRTRDKFGFILDPHADVAYNPAPRDDRQVLRGGAVQDGPDGDRGRGQYDRVVLCPVRLGPDNVSDDDCIGGPGEVPDAERDHGRGCGADAEDEDEEERDIDMGDDAPPRFDSHLVNLVCYRAVSRVSHSRFFTVTPS